MLSPIYISTAYMSKTKIISEITNNHLREFTQLVCVSDKFLMGSRISTFYSWKFIPLEEVVK